MLAWANIAIHCTMCYSLRHSAVTLPPVDTILVKIDCIYTVDKKRHESQIACQTCAKYYLQTTQTHSAPYRDCARVVASAHTLAQSVCIVSASLETLAFDVTWGNANKLRDMSRIIHFIVHIMSGVVAANCVYFRLIRHLNSNASHDLWIDIVNWATIVLLLRG